MQCLTSRGNATRQEPNSLISGTVIATPALDPTCGLLCGRKINFYAQHTLMLGFLSFSAKHHDSIPLRRINKISLYTSKSLGYLVSLSFLYSFFFFFWTVFFLSLWMLQAVRSTIVLHPEPKYFSGESRATWTGYQPLAPNLMSQINWFFLPLTEKILNSSVTPLSTNHFIWHVSFPWVPVQSLALFFLSPAWGDPSLPHFPCHF